MTPQAHTLHQVTLARPPLRRVDVAKLRAKHLNCKTCDGKGCLGKCRFEKIN